MRQLRFRDQRRHIPIWIRALIDFLKERWGDEPYWEQC